MTDFEPYSAFCRIDRDKKKYLTIRDLSKFLIDNSINFTEKNLHILFRSFDKDKDSAISFEEFLLTILSRNDSDLRALVSQKDTYYIGNNDYLSFEVEYCLAKIYEKELKLIDEFVDYTNEARKCIDFNEKYAFRLIDYLDYEYIEEKGLDHFLRKKGYFLNKIDLKNLLTRLDWDGDNIVKFNDFREILFLNIENVKEHSKVQKNQYFVNPSGLNVSTKFKTSINNKSRTKLPNQEDFGNLSTLTSNQTPKQTFDNINLMSSFNSYTSPKGVNKTVNNFSSSGFKQNNFLIEEKTPVRNCLRSISPESESKNIKPRKSDISSLLAQFLQEIMYIDSKLDTAKQALSLKRDFKLNEIFKNFDISLKGYISIPDFNGVLRSLGVFCNSSDDIKILYRRYDLDFDGKLK